MSTYSREVSTPRSQLLLFLPKISVSPSRSHTPWPAETKTQTHLPKEMVALAIVAEWCQEKFPILLVFGFLTSVVPLAVSVTILALYWENDCEVPWHILLLVFAIIFALNFMWSAYLHYRFVRLGRKNANLTAFKRCLRIVSFHPGMILFLIYAAAITIYNVVMIFILENNSCNSYKVLYEMVKVAWIILWIFLAGTLVFGVMTVCFALCRPQKRKDIENFELKSPNQVSDTDSHEMKVHKTNDLWPPPGNQVGRHSWPTQPPGTITADSIDFSATNRPSMMTPPED